MSAFKQGLRLAVKSGRVVAKCGHCQATLGPVHLRERRCPLETYHHCPRGSGFDPVYWASENVVMS